MPQTNPPRSRRRDARYPLVTLGVLALLVAAGGVLRKVPALQETVPIVAAAERPGPDWYLAYCGGGVDHGVLYHDLSGSAAALKKAEVLILGNSGVMFAFKHDQLAEFFGRLGLSYYVLAFAYNERNEFPEALIEKYDLHPKWVIVNADPFFVNRESDMAREVRESTPFDARKRRFETEAAYEVRHRLHAVVPYFELFPQPRDWVLFRNYADGTTYVASHRGTPRPPMIQRKGAFGRAKKKWVDVGRRFEEKMSARGAKLILTTLPPLSPELAIDIGEALDVTVILPKLLPAELMTVDGIHFDDASAHRYVAAFLVDLEKVLRGEELPPPNRADYSRPGKYDKTDEAGGADDDSAAEPEETEPDEDDDAE